MRKKKTKLPVKLEYIKEFIFLRLTIQVLSYRQGGVRKWQYLLEELQKPKSVSVVHMLNFNFRA
ncbi:Predicted protein [Listeria monocytogenes R479a]|nr:Predicted protein [Listeria monocytogenes R479a]CUK33533.1 Predicted protein [Listeria monocytogenes]CUK43155.1 Predicted protein [Listeria monocytogenes]CUL61752.1 Predicted protein [Listeria monocytogenes]CUL67951.1 Predicted protein [Listeria monocytogenes]